MIAVTKDSKDKFLIAGSLILGGIVVAGLFITALGFQQADRKRAAESMHKIGARRSLELEGKKLFRMGRYEDALAKYAEANSPKYDLRENLPYHGSSFYMREIYFMQGRYEEALRDLETLVTLFPEHVPYKDEKKEYEALIQARNMGSNRPIYDCIEYLRAKHKDHLPPLGYTFGTGASTITTLLRLYDTVGDHDAGIAYIDEILAFFRTGKAGDPKPGRVDAEYIKVREAFEQDKASGTKGRATKALIQSDYFPW